MKIPKISITWLISDFIEILKNDPLSGPSCRYRKQFHSPNCYFLIEFILFLLAETIERFLAAQANIEIFKNLKIFRKKWPSARKNTVFWSRVDQTDTRNWLSRVCCYLLMILEAKKFRPISAQYSKKLIVCHVPKPQKYHVDFGHPLRKMAVTSRPLPRLGSNSQENYDETSFTHF